MYAWAGGGGQGLCSAADRAAHAREGRGAAATQRSGARAARGGRPAAQPGAVAAGRRHAGAGFGRCMRRHAGDNPGHFSGRCSAALACRAHISTHNLSMTASEIHEPTKRLQLPRIAMPPRALVP